MNEQERLERAKSCHECTEWLDICNSECCRRIIINLYPEELLREGEFLVTRKALLKDDQWYYYLHGVTYNHGIMKFSKRFCRPFGNRILYVAPCSKLTKDGLCKGHPDNKPRICKLLTEHKTEDPAFEVTENCLFKYKKMLKEGEDEERQE